MASEQELLTRGMAMAADLLLARGKQESANVVLQEVAQRIRGKGESAAGGAR